MSDPAIDALLEKGASTTDQAARDDIYAQVQQWNAEHAAIVPLYSPTLISAVRPDVSGLTFDLYGRPLFDDRLRRLSTDPRMPRPARALC